MGRNLLLKLYVIMSGGVFFLVGLLHLLRMIFQTPVVIGTTSIPMAFSYGGFTASIGAVVLVVYLLRKLVSKQ